MQTLIKKKSKRKREKSNRVVQEWP